MTTRRLSEGRPPFAGVLQGLVLLLLLLTLGARLGRWHWAADILALFHDVYVLAALGALVGLTFLRRYREAFLAGLVLLGNSLLFLPYLPRTAVAATHAPALRLYVHNIYYRNDDLMTVVADVARHDPDVVFLMEYSFAIQEQLEPHFTAYPYRLIEPSRQTMGLALFSKVPLEQAEVRRFPATRIPIFDVTLRLGDEQLSFVGAHPWPPLGRWGALHREQVADVTRVAAAAAHPLVVAGDFNASAWSFALRDLMTAGGVQDARRGFGFAKTFYLNSLFGLPLDHVFVSSGINVRAFRHGDRGGSDHAALVLDLELTGTRD